MSEEFVLSEENVKKATSLKEKFEYQNENIMQRVFTVIQKGGQVILKEKNGVANQIILKT